jgi:hypothetical protein
MKWKISFYSDRVESEVLKLPAGFVARFIRYAERMEIYGLTLVCHTQKQWAMACLSFVLKLQRGLHAFSIARWLSIYCGASPFHQEDGQDTCQGIKHCAYAQKGD